MKTKKIKNANGTLRLGAKAYPCRITMGAMVRFKRLAGYDVNKLKTDNLEDMVKFVWACVQSACRADSIDLDMDFEQFADMLEPEALNEFYAGMGGSDADAAKKKIPARESTS